VTETSPRHQRRSLILVLCCTFIGAAAQLLIKFGAASLTDANPLQIAIHMITTPALFAGFSLYGVSTVLLVLALRHGELSLLYPVFAMSYVWVTILSVVVLHEAMNPYKVAGIVTIVAGVAVLGRGGSR
jgi:drug/metabolite transporter (DMT)-like permease